MSYNPNELEYNIDMINSLISTVSKPNLYLNDAISVLSSITIPEDFEYDYVIKRAYTSGIPATIKQINSINNKIKEIVRNLYGVQNKNKLTIDELIEKITFINFLTEMLYNKKFFNKYSKEVQDLLKRRIIEALNFLGEQTSSDISNANLSEEDRKIAEQLLNYTFDKKIFKNFITTLSNLNRGEGQGLDGVMEITFLATSDKVWGIIYKNGQFIVYEQGVKDINPVWLQSNTWNPNDENNECDCSLLVSVVLKAYGYDIDEKIDQDNHSSQKAYGKGKQLSSTQMYENFPFWAEEYGWEVKRASNGTEASKLVQDGDIIVMRGHTFIVKKVNKDGTIETYDAGSSDYWRGSGNKNGTNSSNYFEPTGANHDKDCIIVTVEDISWKDSKEFIKILKEK